MAAADDSLARPGGLGYTRRSAARAPSGAELCWATKWISSAIEAKDAHSRRPSHRRTALSAIASNTGWRSVGELEITRRISAGRRLLLEGLRQVAVARLQLLEQAHVLDGDDRLVGEGLEAGRPDASEKGSDSIARHADGADGPAPSRTIGTASTVRNRPRPPMARPGTPGRPSRPGRWTSAPVRIARPVTAIGVRARAGMHAGCRPAVGSRSRDGPPRRRGAVPSNRRAHRSSARRTGAAALSAMASNTGWMSVGEPEMTRRISLAARSWDCASASAASASPRRAVSWPSSF